jgi:glycine cleavage system H protein
VTEYLETSVDKFTFRVPTDRFYRREGLWVFPLESDNPSRVRVGMTDYFQQHSGDVAFVTVKPPGTRLKEGQDFADLETIKVNLDLHSPIAGVVAAVNEALEAHPELVNQSPYEEGWLAEIDATDWQAGRALLLDAEAYFAFMKSEAEQEAKKL